MPNTCFLLAGKAKGISEIEQNDKMAHVQLKLAHDAAKAEETKKSAQSNKWWRSTFKRKIANWMQSK